MRRVKAEPADDRAFVFRSGLVKFSATCPKGALPLVSAKLGRPFKRAEIAGLCRVGYDDAFLIPGVPEAESEAAAYRAMRDFCAMADSRLKETE